MKAYCLLFICLVGMWSEGEGGVVRQLHNDCPLGCTLEYRPVCGSDGQTYGNPCALKSAACMTNKVIQLVHSGAC